MGSPKGSRSRGANSAGRTLSLPGAVAPPGDRPQATNRNPIRGCGGAEKMRFALSMPFHRKSRSESNRTAPPRPNNLARRSRLAAFGVLSAHCMVAATGITGTVVDDAGRAIAGARVLINHGPSVKPPVAAPPVITGPLAATVVADASGSFRADNLPPGQYIACAQATAPGFL